MIKADLRRARARWIREAADPAARRDRRRSYFLAVHDADGAVVDFHSQRHTCGTLLGQTAAHPKTIQGLMRHSSIDLTMNRYCHRVVGLEAAALAELPDFGAPPETEDGAEAVRATGTSDATAAGLCAHPCAQEGKSRQIASNLDGRQVELSAHGHVGENANKKAAIRGFGARRGLSDEGSGRWESNPRDQLGRLELCH